LVEETIDTQIEASQVSKREEYTSLDAAAISKKIANREQFIQKMNDSTSKTAGRKLLWSILASALLLVFIVVLEYVLTAQNSKESKYRINIAINTYWIIEAYFKFAYNMERIIYANQGYYIPYYSYSSLMNTTNINFRTIIDDVSEIEATYYLKPDPFEREFRVPYPYIYEDKIVEKMFDYNESLNIVFF